MLVKVLASSSSLYRSLEVYNSGRSNSAISCKREENILVGFALQNLHDVKLVIVGLDFALHKVHSEVFAILFIDLVVICTRHMTVNLGRFYEVLRRRLSATEGWLAGGGG